MMFARYDTPTIQAAVHHARYGDLIRTEAHWDRGLPDRGASRWAKFEPRGAPHASKPALLGYKSRSLRVRALAVRLNRRSAPAGQQGPGRHADHHAFFVTSSTDRAIAPRSGHRPLAPSAGVQRYGPVLTFVRYGTPAAAESPATRRSFTLRSVPRRQSALAQVRVRGGLR